MHASKLWKMDILKQFIMLAFVVCSFICNVSYAALAHSSGYVQADHAKLYYQRFGSGTPIIVVHGGPGLDQTYLQPQMLELAKKYEVIFYDQRGSGKSMETTMDASYYNLAQFTEDLEVVRQQLGLDKFILLGHSFGGLPAMSYAIKYPEHVARLVLVGSAPADVKGILAFTQELDRRIEPFSEEIYPLSDYQEFEKLDAEQIAALYRKLFTVYVTNPEDAEKISLLRSVESARGGFKVNEMISKTLFINLFPQLKKLSVPTIVIHGVDDVVPLWTAEQIQRAIPHAKLYALENSGHFPYIEKPDEFFKILMDM